MLDNVRQIEESPDPAHMDVQGAAVFSMGGTPSVLGEGASVRDVAMDANEEQARVRQQGEEEVRKWHQQKSRMLGSSERESPEGLFFCALRQLAFTRQIQPSRNNKAAQKYNVFGR